MGIQCIFISTLQKNIYHCITTTSLLYLGKDLLVGEGSGGGGGGCECERESGVRGEPVDGGGGTERLGPT